MRGTADECYYVVVVMYLAFVLRLPWRSLEQKVGSSLAGRQRSFGNSAVSFFLAGGGAGLLAQALVILCFCNRNEMSNPLSSQKYPNNLV